MDAFEQALASAVAAVFPRHPAGPLGPRGARVHFSGGRHLDFNLAHVAAETQGWPPDAVRERIITEIRNVAVAAGAIAPDAASPGDTVAPILPPSFAPARPPDPPRASGRRAVVIPPPMSQSPLPPPVHSAATTPEPRATAAPTPAPSAATAGTALPATPTPAPSAATAGTALPAAPTPAPSAAVREVPWERLIPVIRPAGVVYAVAEATSLVRRPISNFLVEFVALRTPEGTLEFVGQRQLADWATDGRTVLARARANLEAIRAVPRRLHLGRSGQTALFATEPQGQESAWIVAPDALRRAAAVEVYGETNAVPVLLFVPTRTTAFLVPRDDERLVGAALDLALELYMDDPGALSPTPYELVGEEVRPWIPEPDSPLATRVDRARGRIAADEYGMQQGFFDSTDVGHRWCERERLRPLRPRQSARGTLSVRLTARDCEGVTALLPEVDVVEILPADAPAILVQWEHLLEVLQPRLYPGLHPRRYALEAWPGEDQLSELGSRVRSTIREV